MFTVVALGPVICFPNGTGSQLTTVNIEGIIALSSIFIVFILLITEGTNYNVYTKKFLYLNWYFQFLSTCKGLTLLYLTEHRTWSWSKLCDTQMVFRI